MRDFRGMGNWRRRRFGRRRWRSLESERASATNTICRGKRGNSHEKHKKREAVMKVNGERAARLIAKAHFDGKQVILDEPLDLAPGTPLRNGREINSAFGIIVC